MGNLPRFTAATVADGTSAAFASAFLSLELQSNDGNQSRQHQARCENQGELLSHVSNAPIYGFTVGSASMAQRNLRRRIRHAEAGSWE